MSQTVLVIVLFASAALAWSPAVMLRHKGRGASRGTFLWLMAGISWWCITSAIHALVPTLAAKIVAAKVQYVAISVVAPLWLLLTAEYAGIAGREVRAGLWRASSQRVWRLALWIIPAITIVVAATNEWHRALWADVHLRAGRAVYVHGWWFWVALGFNYLMLSAATAVLARTIRRWPRPFAGQASALIAAAIVPWVANILYLAGATHRLWDPTPVAFTASGLLFGWAICRNYLFDLIPVARDVVIDSLSDAVIVIDPERRIVDMNAAARELVARHGEPTPRGSETDAEEACIGERLDIVLPFAADVALRATPAESPQLMSSRQTTGMYYEVRVMPLRRRAKRPAAWVMVLRDVSAERAAAGERDALRERLQQQQRRESLSIMAGGLAHDFNNLLAGIVGNADLLALRIPPSSEMGSNVGAILLGAQRAADLVAKMLAYAGERHGSTETIDLDALVRELLEVIRASAGRHCVIHHKGQPATIIADTTQVRQVVMNLIVNAADAVEEGTGEIHVTTGVERLTDVRLRGMDFGGDATPGRYAFLDVRDNGSGMDVGTMQRIFEPFFTTKQSAHGLGLAAVQGIVLGHRGVLRVESDPSWGSRFRVWFPLAPDDPALRPDAQEVAAFAAAGRRG